MFGLGFVIGYLSGIVMVIGVISFLGKPTDSDDV